jgi:exonuclease I
MGQTKKLYYEMTMDELLRHYPGYNDGDEDYQYEEYRQKQLEAEQQAYEQHLAEKY